MTTRLKDPGWLPAMLVALLCSLILSVSFPGPGMAQARHDFSVTVDPLASCAPKTPVTGTVTLTGLTSGYGFSVQLGGDGEVLDGQTFEGYTDGTYAWSVASPAGAPHDILELSFALRDGDGAPIRTETVALNPDCDLYPAATPATPTSPSASPVTTIPATNPASTRTGVDNDRESNPVLVAGFAGATVLVLAALAFLDRRPEP